jgi:hypothetical protein
MAAAGIHVTKVEPVNTQTMERFVSGGSEHRGLGAAYEFTPQSNSRD